MGEDDYGEEEDEIEVADQQVQQLIDQRRAEHGEPEEYGEEMMAEGEEEEGEEYSEHDDEHYQ